MSEEKELRRKLERSVYTRLWVLVERVAKEFKITTEAAQDLVWEQAEIVAHEDPAADAA